MRRIEGTCGPSKLDFSIARNTPGAGVEEKGLMRRSFPNPAGAEPGAGLGRIICQVWAWAVNAALRSAAAASVLMTCLGFIKRDGLGFIRALISLVVLWARRCNRKPRDNLSRKV